jgi:hypothetical protein
MTPRAAKHPRRPAAIWRTCLPLSPLDAFCRRYAITTPQLARAASVTRQHTSRIRAGKVPNLTISTAKLLALGASRIVRRKVAVGELFDLEIGYRPPARVQRKAR